MSCALKENNCRRLTAICHMHMQANTMSSHNFSHSTSSRYECSHCKPNRSSHDAHRQQFVTFGARCASDIHVAWLRALHAALCCGQCFFWQSLPQYAVTLHPLQTLVSSALPQTTQGLTQLTGMGASGDSLWRSCCARSDNRSLRKWTA